MSPGETTAPPAPSPAAPGSAAERPRAGSGGAALRGRAAGGAEGRAAALAPPLAAALGLWLLAFPAPRGLGEGPWSTALYARDGSLLGAAVAADGSWRLPPGGEPPDYYVEALLAFEDRKFLGHPGFDAAAILRAARDNLASGSVVSGGSTLSMQLARLLSPPGPRTLPAKLRELRLALGLELRLGKAGILEAYAARAPFGGNLVGLEAASFRIFGHEPGLLTRAEAAALAVLPNAPSAASLSRNRELLRAKRDRLLRSMAERGLLGEEELSLALAEPLPPEPFPMPSLAPQLLARARSEGRGPRVRTSLDAALQERVEELARRRIAALSANGIWNAACLVADLRTGEVLAYLGNVELEPGRDRGQANDMVRARRSSGSLLKPFLYAAALQSGELAPRALLPDLPTRIGSYAPENNTGTYGGAVPADEALARSLNVPFVRLLRSFGVERFLGLLRGLRLDAVDRGAGDYGLSLILGGAEVRLEEIAAAYAGLGRAAAGLPPLPGGRLRWEDDAAGGSAAGALASVGSDADVARAPGATARAAGGAPPSAEEPYPLGRGAAWLTLRALLEVARPGEEASWQEYASSRRVAWKTGTSFGYRDAWAVGITPERVVAVWVGNASGEGRPDLRGYHAAAPLLFDVFQALPRSPWFPEPEGELEPVETCADSGFVAGRDCVRTRTELLPRGRSRAEPCPYCRLVHLTEDGRFQVDAAAAGGAPYRTERRFVLPPALEFWYGRARPSYRPLPPVLPGSSAPGRAFSLLFPEAGSRIYVPIELDGSLGKAVFRAVAPSGTSLYWHLDGYYLGETRGPHELELRPAPGRRKLLVVDSGGRREERSFEVLGGE